MPYTSCFCGKWVLVRTYTQQGGVRERSDAAELDRGKVGARPDVVLPVRRSPVNAQRPAFLTVTVSHLHIGQSASDVHREAEKNEPLFFYEQIF